MTDKKQHDVDARTASAISDLYRQIQASEPNTKVDAKILAAAHHSVQKTKYRRAWTIPAAIAAMLLIGLSIFWWQHLQAPMPIDNKVSSAPIASDGLSQQVDKNLHDNLVADQWLERILKLNNAGKHDQAAEEFRQFRQAYPVYSLDKQRFGALLQYDKK